MPFAERIWNGGLESGIRRRASRAARFARSRATLVQNLKKKKNADTARYSQILPTHARNGQIVPYTGQIRKKMLGIYVKRFQNARRERNGAQRTPPGSRMERKGCHKGTKGVPNGTNGAPTEPKGSQKVAKGPPKCSQHDLLVK